MGAWGVGFRENDTGLDAIYAAEELLRLWPSADGNDIFAYVIGHWTVTWSEDGEAVPDDVLFHLVLGLADYLLEIGKDLSAVKGYVERFIALGKTEEMLSAWKHPAKRLDALQAFEDVFQQLVKWRQHRHGSRRTQCVVPDKRPSGMEPITKFCEPLGIDVSFDRLTGVSFAPKALSGSELKVFFKWASEQRDEWRRERKEEE